MCSQTETMFKSKLYMTKTIHRLLSHYSSTKWGGGEGGAYLKFWLIGGALIPRGSLFQGGGVLIRGFTVILLIDIDLSITYFFSNHRFSSIGHPRVSVLEKKNKTKLTGERGNGL